MAQIYQVTMQMLWLGQECRNVFYAQIPGTAPETEAQAVAAVLEERYNILAASLVDTWQLYGAMLRRVDLPGYPEYSAAGIGPTVGGTATDSVATQVAGVVTFKASTPRPNKSPKFISGLPEAAFEDSVITSGYSATLAAWASGIMGGITALGSGYSLVCAQWNASKTFVEATNPVSFARVGNIPGTQRRRKIGRGQ
jgi:hypothetical protein